MSKWVVTWNACFGALSANRADAMEVYINDKLNGLQSGEMDKAIEQVANALDGKAPSVPMIIAIIQEQRKRARGIDTTEPYDVTESRRNIARMPVEGLDRWDAVCNVHCRHKGLYTKRAIDTALREGGLTIPWWANADMIRHTHQEPKPPGVTGMRDLITQARSAVRYEHQDDEQATEGISRYAKSLC
jgi:hypothetical protein